MALQSYRFEHPKRDDQVVTIGGWSYLWAGLFGALYVAVVGGGQWARALLINLVYLLVFLAVVGGSSLLAPLAQLGLIVLSVPVLIMMQGTSMIRLVRNGYRRRGWWVLRA
jgi:hypothetical protein